MCGKRVGLCAGVISGLIDWHCHWRWLVFEVMHLEVHPVQIEGQQHVHCSVGAAAAESLRLAVLKLQVSVGITQQT